MAENGFAGPPANGTQVMMTNTGAGITPFRVTVTENGILIKQLDFALKVDAERTLAQEQKAAINAARS